MTSRQCYSSSNISFQFSLSSVLWAFITVRVQFQFFKLFQFKFTSNFRKLFLSSSSVPVLCFQVLFSSSIIVEHAFDNKKYTLLAKSQSHNRYISDHSIHHTCVGYMNYMNHNLVWTYNNELERFSAISSMFRSDEKCFRLSLSKSTNATLFICTNNRFTVQLILTIFRSFSRML
jgi:hypothetical protein